MASTSRKVAATKQILTPSMTLEGHGKLIQSISYFPDGQRMISGSHDKTTRQWDMKAGKEIGEARDVCKVEVWAVAVSRDGQCVVTGGRDSSGDHAELKACKVETGIVRTFEGHSKSWKITCIDISMDNKLLASGADYGTARICNLDTGKLVAGPFKGIEWPGAVRFSIDSKKLAVKSWLGTCLEVWDVQSQTLDVRRGVPGSGPATTPLFWTTNKNIIAPFSFPIHPHKLRTIYEFDASTLETVGTPFEGHTENITGLALSFDRTLLASASIDYSIKLWAIESRQLLASFDVQNPITLVLSPDLCKLAYTTHTKDDYKIYVCNTPPAVLAWASTSACKKSARRDLRNSGATRLPAGRRRPPISVIPMSPRPPPTINPKQPVFLRLSKLLRFAPRTNTVHPARNDRHPIRDPLDVPATLSLPSPLSGQGATQFDHFGINSLPPRPNGVTQFLRQHLSFLVPRHSLAPVVEVAPGRKFTRLAAVKLPEYKKVDDTRHPSSQQATVPHENDSSDVHSLPDVHWCTAFLCYYSCLSHGSLRMPPRWRLERVDIPRQDGTTNGSRSGTAGVQPEEIEMKPMASQSQPEAGPSRLAVADEHLGAQSS